MKKVILFTTVVALLVSLVAVPIAMAKKGDTPANDKPNTLYLYEKDTDWEIVWDGAWGAMSLNPSGKGTFNGHGLTADTGYTLVIYNGWPDVTVIGSGTANKGGNVNISGSPELATGDKVWLVLSDDITGDELTAWNPSEYLFEHNLIP
jgi:hypothetical protein